MFLQLGGCAVNVNEVVCTEKRYTYLTITLKDGKEIVTLPSAAEMDALLRALDKRED